MDVDDALVELDARFPARPEGLGQLHAAFASFFALSDRQSGRPAIPEVDRIALVTAAGELAANIVRHACRHLPDAEMSLVLASHRDRVEVAFEDPGEPFYLAGSASRKPYVERHGPARSPDPRQGGMGLSVIRAAVDTVEYEREGGTNRWRLTRWTNILHRNK